MSFLSPKEKQLLCEWSRLIVYFFGLIGIVVGIWYLADFFERDTFSENGIIENTQCIVLGIAALVFGWTAYQFKSHRPLLLGLMSLCLLGICREQDAWFDETLPILSWRIGFILPTLALCNGLRDIKSCKRQLMHFLSMPASYIMYCAMLVIVPLAQCLGHKALILAVVEPDNVYLARGVRRLVEESAEFLGYILILIAAIELYLNIKSILTHSSKS